MRPILIELAPEDHAPKRSRSNGSNRPRVARPSSFATALPRECDERVSAIAAAVRAEPDDWHELFLALSGALLDRGIPPAMLPAFVESVSVATCSDTKTDDRRRGAETTVERASLGAAFASWGTLMRRWPRVADAVAAAFAPVVEPSAGVELPPARDGIQLLAAECGMGKTRRAEERAFALAQITHRDTESTSMRAPLGSKTSISVDKHALAVQIAANLRARGAAVQRVFGPLSVEGPGACKLKSHAEPLARGGQSVAMEFCEGRRKSRCPHWDGCTARLGIEGDEGARITVGPHALLAQLDGARGATGLLIIDEPPPLLVDIIVTLEDLAFAAKHLDSLETAYAERMRIILSSLATWAKHGIEPDRAALRQSVPEEKVPPLRWDAVYRARVNVAWATSLGAMSRVCRDVLRALRNPTALVGVEMSHIVLTIPNEQLVRAMSSGQVLIMSADVERSMQMYERVLGYAPPITRFAASDGAPIERTMVRVRASRTAWGGGEGSAGAKSFERQVRRALNWADGCSVGIVTFMRFEGRLVAAIDLYRAAGGRVGDVRTAHFGGTRGLDSWKDLDAVVTLGDPRPNVGAVEREATWAGIATEGRAESAAAAELEQCHGRLRTVHRTRPGRALHVGQVRPSGSGWRREDVVVQDDLGGGDTRSKRLPDKNALLLEIEAADGVTKDERVAVVAARYGVGPRTVWRRL